MARPPNILLIVADDMGYGDFGRFGDDGPRTPTLDGLIDEGVCLTQHYSGSPVCAPAATHIAPAPSHPRRCSASTACIRGR